MEIEVSHSKIPIKVLKYINELYLNLKSSLKKISELKKENSRLRQHDFSRKEKFEILQKDFLQTKESRDLLVKENDSLKNEFSNISPNFQMVRKYYSIFFPYKYLTIISRDLVSIRKVIL